MRQEAYFHIELCMTALSGSCGKWGFLRCAFMIFVILML